ncbi:hypothetical protein [Sediminitomix flava]|uniref:YXYXY domain-containing protein n=1 Tax=Sediminitomix flava TaxID=379075 RepID=A0A315ZDY8_SEDFL|nr:hypothetical protein [Sediminitomix flava]PWJ42964.1 hypothetical protein BC781_102511 [Sediminitomix flava]
MKAYFLLILFYLLSYFSFAQNGHYYLTHYAPSFIDFEEQRVQTVQDNEGVMYFSNRKGVLKYNGKDWNLLETPSSVFSLAYAEKQNYLLVGGRNSLGYIQKDIYGDDQYFSLSEDHIIGLVSKISIVKNKAYILADGEVFIIDLNAKKIIGEYYEHIAQHLFTAMNEPYFIDEEQNIYLLKEQEAEVADIKLPDSTSIQFVADYNNKVVIGDSSGTWFQFDGLALDTLKNQNKKWLKESAPHQIISLNDSLNIIATEKGGAVIYNLFSGDIDFYLNYTTGLPDSEIKGIGKDKYGGIWFAHEYGFSRTNHLTPLRNYALYEGLEGNILSAIEFDGRLFTGTSEGLYELAKIDKFKEVDKVVKLRKRRKSKDFIAYQAKEKELAKLSEKELKKQIKEVEEEEEDAIKDFEKDEKKLRRKWRKEQRKKLKEAKKENKDLDVDKWKKEQEELFEKEALARKEKMNSTTIATIKKKTAVVKKPVRKYEYYYEVKKDKELILQSTKYKYKVIPEIEAKCRILQKIDTFLVVGSNKGTALISPNGDLQWLNQFNVQTLHVSEKTNELIVADENGDIWAKRLTKGGIWVNIDGVHNAQLSSINTIYIDQQDLLWLVNHEMIHCFSTHTDNKRDLVSSVNVNNPFGDDIGIWDKDSSETHFILHNGIYTFNKDLGTLENVSLKQKLKSSDQFRVLQGHDGIVWSYLKTGWTPLLNGRHLSDEPTFYHLNQIPQIRAILPSEDPEKLWVITKGNQLFCYEYTESQIDNKHYDLNLATLKDMKGQKIPINDLDFSYRNNNFLFSFSQPQYEIDKEILYRFKLNDNPWSSWTKESHIPFHLLNSGKYALKVESGNGNGSIYSSYSLDFNIALPYWKKTWFYALELLFFSFLLVFSFKLNQSKRVNIWISKVLTYLTLIMVFAFLETVAQYYINLEPDPLLDFGIEASLAILLLPFENVFKKLIAFTRNTDSDTQRHSNELNNIKETNS